MSDEPSELERIATALEFIAFQSERIADAIEFGNGICPNCEVQPEEPPRGDKKPSN